MSKLNELIEKIDPHFWRAAQSRHPYESITKIASSAYWTLNIEGEDCVVGDNVIADIEAAFSEAVGRPIKLQAFVDPGFEAEQHLGLAPKDFQEVGVALLAHHGDSLGSSGRMLNLSREELDALSSTTDPALQRLSRRAREALATTLEDRAIFALASDKGRDGETEFDDSAAISRGDDNGAYVSAWVWVPFEGTPLDCEIEDEDEGAAPAP